MNIAIPFSRYHLLEPIFAPLDIHLALRAALDGSVPAEIWVDDREHPASALVKVNRRCYLAGSAENAGFNASLRGLFAQTLFPNGLSAGEEVFVLHAPVEWESVLGGMLKGHSPLRAEREYYARETALPCQVPPLPGGYELCEVDSTLLAETSLENMADLKEEMRSERPSVEDFLAKSFGVAVRQGNALAGWCLSEYNSAGRCEVGIATLPGHQRQGLATAMTAALVAMARERGLREVGWHCFARNLPSAATARRAGFRLVMQFPIWLVWYDESQRP